MEGRPLVERTITLDQRQAVAAVEQSLIGMKEGGYRKVRTSPHLAYGGATFSPSQVYLTGIIPPSVNAELIICRAITAPPFPEPDTGAVKRSGDRVGS